MSKWAIKRQFFYFSIIFGVILIFLAILIIPSLIKEPTCFDGKSNGKETGVDCGGSCVRVCSSDARDIIVLWKRPFKVTNNIYNALAYIENQNIDFAISNIKYEFRLYDKNNVLVSKREGSTFVDPNSRSAIFEAGINVGNRIPTKVSFEFIEVPNWKKVDASQVGSILGKIIAKDRVFSNDGIKSSLQAKIVNNSLYTLKDLDIIAILYDKSQNAFAVSKTYLETLNKTSEKEIFFTWPNVFEEEAFKIEIMPRINSFSIDF